MAIKISNKVRLCVFSHKRTSLERLISNVSEITDINHFLIRQKRVIFSLENWGLYDLFFVQYPR